MTLIFTHVRIHDIFTIHFIIHIYIIIIIIIAVSITCTQHSLNSTLSAILLIITFQHIIVLFVITTFIMHCKLGLVSRNYNCYHHPICKWNKISTYNNINFVIHFFKSNSENDIEICDF